MYSIKFDVYANNEVRFGYDEIPYPKRKTQLCAAARRLQETGVALDSAREKFLRDNNLFRYKDKDGKTYTWGSDSRPERYGADKGLLDIICESQRAVRAKKNGSPFWERDVLPTVFGRRGKHLLLESGAVFDKDLSDVGRSYVYTFTLPGGTSDAFRVLGRSTGYIANRLLQRVRRVIQKPCYFYVWENQKRGALHLHLCLSVPFGICGVGLAASLRDGWYKILLDVSQKSGVCLFESREGGRCTVSKYWQFDFQPVRKSVAAYFSKYAGKNSIVRRTNDAIGGHSVAFAPRRWWSVSSQVRVLIRRRRFSLAIIGVTRDDCMDAISRMSAMIASMQSLQTYAYEKPILIGNGVKIGTTSRSISYFLPEEFRCVDVLFRYEAWAIARAFPPHLLQWGDGSAETTLGFPVAPSLALWSVSVVPLSV